MKTQELIRKQFKITIDASAEKVWNALWEHKNYEDWSAAFCEGSHVKGDWSKGSKILFLDGEGRGMVSTVKENIPNAFMSFEHVGEVADGVEDTESEKVKSWAGALENYTLKEANGKTELTIDTDISDEYAEMFEGMWPKALARLKSLAENK